MKLSITRSGFAISLSAFLLCFSLAIFTSVAHSQDVPAPTSSTSHAATPENAPDPSQVAAEESRGLRSLKTRPLPFGILP